MPFSRIEGAPLVRTSSPLGKVERLPGLGRQADRRHAFVPGVGVTRHPALKRGVRPTTIAAIEVAPKPAGAARTSL